MKTATLLVLLNVGLVSSLSILLPTNETDVKCHKHAEFNKCGSSCPLTCEDVVKGNPPKLCPTLCKPDCQCKKGYAIGKNGRCVKESHCKKRGLKNLNLLTDPRDANEKKVKCPKHSEFRNCSDLCPPTCEDKKICHSLRCGLPKCQCKFGYGLGGAEYKECVKCNKTEDKKTKQ
ncbi:unnamed protein product [Bursaphelenchus xylophilus]|uniref:(pine wood nematode) hypothetical protein n=1 Tax=Bursaphelenchus xylophilus TaxID=6326 RepID=A0A1I7RZ14_BURXY|nr:unnamed protein product [Bursaphelenchus xylophilus]CAG9106957.1 unnamed protein product [Bursaphelenchus xylophilus]